MYLHGLAFGDCELALRGLLGDGAPLSASAILRLKANWQAQYTAWQQRDLSRVKLVYLWADGIYVKAGLEDSKAALLVLIGADASGQKFVLAVESGQRESTESWAAVLRDLKRRGLRAPLPNERRYAAALHSYSCGRGRAPQDGMVRPDWTPAAASFVRRFTNSWLAFRAPWPVSW